MDDFGPCRRDDAIAWKESYSGDAYTYKPLQEKFEINERVWKKLVFVYCHWCEENEMVFVSYKVPFPDRSDRRSRVAGINTECEVKTIELSSSTSGGEQWAFLNFLILTAVKKTVPKLRKWFMVQYDWWLVLFVGLKISMQHTSTGPTRTKYYSKNATRESLIWHSPTFFVTSTKVKGQSLTKLA